MQHITDLRHTSILESNLVSQSHRLRSPGKVVSLPSLKGNAYVSRCHACVSADLFQPLQHPPAASR